jgi:acyl-phosphate glycerol 3-phosphate acyltransferase
MAFAPWLSILAAYLIGAIPFGYLVARFKGVDIFHAGSGNIGATNVGRVLGRRLGLLVFLLDFLKGAVPVAVVRQVLPDHPWAAVAAGLAAFVGHMFPVYLRFRGGKGVATGSGVVAVLLPGPTAAAIVVWVSVLVATRYVSLASVLAAVTLAVVRLLTTPQPFGEAERIPTAFSLLAALLVIARHRSNLGRLSRGTENRLADTPKLRMAARILHILALSLWFGGGVMFSFVVAPSLFATFRGLESLPEGWQGTRIPGIAVGPIFPLYFALQGMCGLVALLTAWGWTRSHPERVHRVRFLVIALALTAVVVGWPLVGKVGGLRVARDAGDAAAKSAFATWHTVSLLLDCAALVLVGVATALAARLPADRPDSPAKAESDRSRS